MFAVQRIVWRLTGLPMNEDVGSKPFLIVRTLWRLTLDPIYHRFFRRWFQNLSGRIDELRADIRDQDAELRNQTAAVLSHSAAISDYGVELRTHIHGLNTRLDDFAVRLADLDERVRTVIAAHWEQEAIARRIASLEDRIDAS